MSLIHHEKWLVYVLSLLKLYFNFIFKIHFQEKNGNLGLSSQNLNSGPNNFTPSELTEINANGIKGLGMSESFTMGTPQRRPYKEITKVSMAKVLLYIIFVLTRYG